MTETGSHTVHLHLHGKIRVRRHGQIFNRVHVDIVGAQRAQGGILQKRIGGAAAIGSHPLPHVAALLRVLHHAVNAQLRIRFPIQFAVQGVDGVNPVKAPIDDQRQSFAVLLNRGRNGIKGR